MKIRLAGEAMQKLRRMPGMVPSRMLKSLTMTMMKKQTMKLKAEKRERARRPLEGALMTTLLLAERLDVSKRAQMSA